RRGRRGRGRSPSDRAAMVSEADSCDAAQACIERAEKKSRTLRVMPTRAIRLKPRQPTTLGDYALDHVTVELGEDETQRDFRLELGLDLGIYWALPAARHDRLRLAHVDGAAYHVDEP